MADVNIRLNLEMSPRLFRAFFPLVLLSVLAGDLASEAVTLNTYYPAPSGIYTQMIATGNTTLARDGGCVDVGTTAACAAGVKLAVMGNVGFGTLNPGNTLMPNGVALEVGPNQGPNSPGGLAFAINGQILVGDSTSRGGVYFNGTVGAFKTAGPANIPTQFLGTLGDPLATVYTPVYTGYPPYVSPGVVPAHLPLVLLNGATATGTGAGIISIDQNGYVGIGTSQPGQPLHVKGVMTGRSWIPLFQAPF